MEISDKSFVKSARRVTTKSAWARLARRRWPTNTVKSVMAEWGLSEGEARGLVYGQASQATIDKILDHARGGFSLGLEALAVKTAMTLEQFVEQQAAKAAAERAAWECRERRLKDIEAQLRGGAPQ